MAVKKLRKPLEISSDGTAVVGLGYDTNGNPVISLKSPFDKRAKSIQYNGIIPKVYIDELRDGSFLDRKEDIKKLLKYRKEFQSSVDKSLDDIKKTIINLTEQINSAVTNNNSNKVDMLCTELSKSLNGLISIKEKQTTSSITASKSTILTFKEYDNLISGLIDEGFDLKRGDFSKGIVILDWHSGSGVSIEFSTKPIWEENKIEITNTKLDVSGIEDINSSRIWEVMKRYLTNFEIPFEKQTTSAYGDGATEQENDEDDASLGHPRGIGSSKSSRILNKGKWNEAEIVEVDDTETEYRMKDKDFNFATIEDLIRSMLDVAEANGDYEEAIDFLSSIPLSDSIVDYTGKTGFVVVDISDFLDETVKDWEKEREYDAPINASITKILANIIDR